MVILFGQGIKKNLMRMNKKMQDNFIKKYKKWQDKFTGKGNNQKDIPCKHNNCSECSKCSPSYL